MANKPLQTLKFPDLPDTYTVPQVDDTLEVEGAAADAKKVGDALATKAEIDGYYQDLTAGNAEQLISTIKTIDQVPYLFRTAGGWNDIGNRETKTIVGVTVKWNQLANTANNPLANVCTYVRNSDGSFTITPNNYESNAVGLYWGAKALSSGKVYLCSAEVKPSSDANFKIVTSITSNYNNTPANVWTKLTRIVKPTSDIPFTVYCGAQYSGWSGTETYDLKNYQFFDLTAKFGSAIADYLYNLEQSTPGAGVAKLKSWGFLQKDYYEYNPGELLSVEGLQSHDTVGFNQFDKSQVALNRGLSALGVEYLANGMSCSDFIRVVPSATYYYGYTGTATFYHAIFYDSDKQYIGRSIRGGAMAPCTETLPDDCHYVRLNVGMSQLDSATFNLSWSGTRNGEYAPYVKHSYPLDSTLTLRGIPKLDANGNLYYDGDTYESDGTVNRRYREIVADGVNVRVSGGYGAGGPNYLPAIVLGNGEYKAANNTASIQSSYLTATATFVSQENTIGVGNGGQVLALHIGTMQGTDGTHGYNSAAELLNAVNAYLQEHPLTIVYPLAEPTTEQAAPYQNPQIVDDWGTEEYVTDSIVPVGHYTEYMANLRDKLQHLPDLASVNGDYIVRQVGTNMSLVPKEDVKELPDAPTTDGTYRLVATVNNGQVTLSWEVIS